MTIWLEPHAEKVAPAHPLFHRSDGRPLLYHQLRTLLALGDYELVVNTYNTGTGKTRASLMYLLDPAMQGENVLIIAPTNALLHQHATDIRQFVADHHLRHLVYVVTADEIGKLKPDHHLRKGEILYRLIQNAREFLEAPTDLSERPLILVINPDILHYALFQQYGAADQRNVFAAIITAFTYIIIDEFHYYDSKQLTSFLFFFSLLQEWSYFQHGRKVCLLSATPTDHLKKFLQRIFQNRWTLLSPENEPPESERLERIHTLAPLELELTTDPLPEWIAKQQTLLSTWKDQGLDTAIISSSLRKINEVYSQLTHWGLAAGRITSPEPEVKRLAAINQPFILATPTVDIGYNFDRQGKERQPLDVVVFDARFHDEAIQRLGRAGRVLGRTVINHPSHAVALLPEEAYQELQQYDGQRFTRPAFNTLMQSLEPLPAKHRLSRYISRYGIIEAVYPVALHARREATLADQKAQQARLVKMLLDTFAPESGQKLPNLDWGFKTFLEHERFIQERKHNQRWLPPDHKLYEHVKRLLKWMTRSSEIQDLALISQFVQAVKRGLPSEQLLEQFINEQYALTKALFSFREAFSGPAAYVFDPEHLLSSERTNQYDLFHVLENYHYRLLEPDEYRTLAGALPARQPYADEASPIYLHLKERHIPRAKVQVCLKVSQQRKHFDDLYTCRPVARKALRLQLLERGEQTAKPLHGPLARAIEECYVPFFAVPDHASGLLINFLRQTPIYSRPLLVNFSNGDEATYQAVFGSGAFHVEAERGWYLRNRKRDDDEKDMAIIL